MKYVLELYFNDVPKCESCMLARSKGLNLDGETVIGCAALGPMPKCSEEAKRKDCPLKNMEK